MKNSKMITIIAIIALVLIIAVTLVSGTFARYTTTSKTTATVATAAWSFKAGLGTSTGTAINLYDTITTPSTTYPNLADQRIAPGTTGSFKVVVDGKGSEVGIDYTIKISAASGTTLPTGLVFKDGTTTIDISAGKTITGTIAKANVATAVEKTITWEWAIGDDANAETGLNNDDQGKSLTINVDIKGTQHIGAIEP